MREDDRGFTLIELLVVVLVIAILAAIAVPVFLNQRKKSYEAQIQSSLKSMADAVETAAIDPTAGGSYASLDGLTGNDLGAYGFTMPGYLAHATIEANATEFCIEAEHSSLGATDPWRLATYDSDVGAPATTDHCPKLV